MPSENSEKIIEGLMLERLEENVKLVEFLKSNVKVIIRVADAISAGFRNGKKVLLFGNGGSAADAQHIAGEFVGRFRKERKGLPAIALSTNSSSVTAIGNDYGFENVFSRQVEAFGMSGDVAVGISTTGNSRNVVSGIDRANAMGLATIGLSGGDGGELMKGADICITVPSEETAIVQEFHIIIGHLVCGTVERSLFE